MNFTETKLRGAYVVELERKSDNRGFFARAWCKKEFQAQNLTSEFVQCNVSWNESQGTLRGMHRQVAPYEECKLIRCTQGAIYDVILDLRRDSETFGKWLGFELTARNHRSLFVPGGFAVGYQTLEDNSELTYLVSQFYAPGFEEGVRYNDPAFGIEWPRAVSAISEKDKSWTDYPYDHRR
jgi:dTDP-4-dehydrorhamnose 3,5-epimerase